jgi:hypothetical protein
MRRGRLPTAPGAITKKKVDRAGRRGQEERGEAGKNYRQDLRKPVFPENYRLRACNFWGGRGNTAWGAIYNVPGRKRTGFAPNRVRLLPFAYERLCANGHAAIFAPISVIISYCGRPIAVLSSACPQAASTTQLSSSVGDDLPGRFGAQPQPANVCPAPVPRTGRCPSLPSGQLRPQHTAAQPVLCLRTRHSRGLSSDPRTAAR